MEVTPVVVHPRRPNRGARCDTSPVADLLEVRGWRRGLAQSRRAPVRAEGQLLDGPGIGLQWSTRPRRHPPTNTQPDDFSAGLVALMMAESIPSVAWWVAWMVMSTNPASSSRWRYSEYESAPAMH